MFFKRLEIIGFKSFATRTVVEFLPGVTVIVGPNGCGKSNILDSIKWVLGTQSAKSLRGGKMMDVIFAGSASFKPLGVAQVTLTIDNSQRILDIEYDEVQITRRLFRTGESEYQLNKTTCRLRDIHDLFLGTGIGTSAYSILEQGKIDQIVNAKPEERRFIFEEAAGISKYKLRKLEALRKLERTAEDLKRLQDLIGEVGRQVGSLKRQATKAETFKTLSANLRLSDMRLMALRSRGTREHIMQLEIEIADLKERGEAMRTRFAEVSEAERSQKEISTDLEESLSARNQELFEVGNRLKDLEHQAERHNSRIRANEARLDKIEEEVDGIDRQSAELADRRAKAEEHAETTEREMTEAAENVAEQERTFAELREQVTESQRQLESLTREMTRLRERLSHCENVIRAEDAHIIRGEQSRMEAEQVIEQLSAVVSENDVRIADLKIRMSGLAERVERADQTSATLQIRYAESRTRIGDMNRELEQLRRDLHQRQARLATLRELKSNFEGFFQGVRELMKASQRGDLQGVIGPVVNLLKTRGEYELALEAALGAHLQDIVVDTTPSAMAGLEFLAKGNHGRVTFLPLDRLATAADPAKIAEVLAQEGVLGHAPELVEHDQNLGRVVRALLAGAFLTRDLATAERLSAQFPGLTYVALNGQVIRANGAMVGGNLKTTGLLGREREIADLGKDVEELGRKQETLQNALLAERENSESLASAMEDARAELNELKVENASVVKEHEQISRTRNDSADRLQKRDDQLRRLNEEIEGKKALKAQMEEDRERLALELRDASERHDALREQSRETSEIFMAAGSRLGELRTKLERGRERLTHLRTGLASLEREAAALTQTAEARRAERARLDEENELARMELETVSGPIEGLAARRNELGQQVGEERSRREELLMQLKQMAHEMDRLSRDERVAGNDLHEREVLHAKLQANYAGMVEQAREKFDRALEEIIEEVGEFEANPKELASEVAQLRERIDRIGPVNLAALEEFNEQTARLTFLTTQEKDLVESKEQIELSISQLDEKTKQLFHETFESIRGHFVEMFRRLFNGGKADLVIDQTSPDPLLDGGVEIFAQPPGKKLQSLSLMSGGEKAMTAVSLLFALFLHKPSPFCVLDEIDAPLDDANVERFKKVVAEFNKTTQFVIITHNKQTMELADAIYGVTMEESGVSKLVSVKFEQAEEALAGSAG